MKEYIKPLFHYSIHIVLFYLMIRFISQDFLSTVSLIIGGATIMFDNLLEIKRTGFMKYLYLRSVLDDWKYRRYFLHTPATLIISLTLSLLVFAPKTFYFCLFFFSMVLHLLIDLIEIRFIHKIPLKNWILKTE